MTTITAELLLQNKNPDCVVIASAGCRLQVSDRQALLFADGLRSLPSLEQRRAYLQAVFDLLTNPAPTDREFARVVNDALDRATVAPT